MLMPATARGSIPATASRIVAAVAAHSSSEDWWGALLYGRVATRRSWNVSRSRSAALTPDVPMSMPNVHCAMTQTPPDRRRGRIGQGGLPAAGLALAYPPCGRAAGAVRAPTDPPL